MHDSNTVRTLGKIVFTNGCFDLFHLGHLYTLEYARLLAGPSGNVIVGLNSDYSISLIKGDKRPIISQDQRQEILESIRYVDACLLFDAETPYELIKAINPDIIVKGRDYRGKEHQVIGADIAEIAIVPEDLCPNISTSAIIDRINKL